MSSGGGCPKDEIDRDLWYFAMMSISKLFLYWAIVLMGSFSGVAGEMGKVALTFDDGPDKELTPRLLDILKASGARATFFPIGEKVGKHPALISRIVKDGHELGNHGWGHLKMTRLDEATVRREIRLTNMALKNVAGIVPQLFRPPHGLVDSRLKKLVRLEGGLETVTWNLVCGDWKKVSSPYIETRVLSGIRNGAIVLMHDTNPQTIMAMTKVVPELRKRGYNMVPVSELNEKIRTSR